MGEGFGATHTINASSGDPVAQVREIADGVGVDFAYEAVGIPKTIEQAVASLAYAGTATHIGLPENDQHVNLISSATWTPASIGTKRRSKFATLAATRFRPTTFHCLRNSTYKGQLKLDEMVTARIGLEDVNGALPRDGARRRPS